MCKIVILTLALVSLSLPVLAEDLGLVAAKPLYRDPVYNGAADPTTENRTTILT